jgi:hypothetical protein
MTGDDGMSDQLPDDEKTLRDAGMLLRGAMPPMGFSDGFAERTMARLARERAAAPPEVLRVSAMQKNFRFLAAAAAIAIVALGAHNTLIARTDDSSLLEAALGLQPVSAESILSSSSDAFQ